VKFNLLNKNNYKYACLTLALISAFWVISIFELYLSVSSNITVSNLGKVVLYKFLNDFWAALLIGALFFPLFLSIHTVLKKGAFTIIKILFVLFIILQFSLVKYSLTTLINLGADILGYSLEDIFSTVSTSETISLPYLIPFVVFPLLFFLINFSVNKYANTKLVIGVSIGFVLVFGCLKLIVPNASEPI